MVNADRWVLSGVMLAVLLSFHSGARAQQARIDITMSGTSACNFSRAVGVGSATVRVVNSFPFQTVRFKVPAPCGIVIVNHTSAFAVSGDPRTGIEIDLGACTSAPVDVLSVVFFVPQAVSGCTWDVLPADGDANILLADCDGWEMKGASARGWLCGDIDAFIAPYRPVPPDGSTGVPTNVLLAFTGVANEISLTDHPPVYFGEGVFCSVFGTLCSNPFDPGILQPNTTYYWRTGHFCTYCPHGEGAISDLWTFTTGDAPLSAERSTWGRIKALYRY